MKREFLVVMLILAIVLALVVEQYTHNIDLHLPLGLLHLYAPDLLPA